jgi:2-methylaconitate cis-trans-isomerase PrpF
MLTLPAVFMRGGTSKGLMGAMKREAIRIGTPSGILAVGAAVEQAGPNAWIAQRGSFFRTTRRLFAGRLYLQLS